MNQVESSKKLNPGCGCQVIDGWINVDYALGARLARIPFLRASNRKARLFDLDWNDRIFIHDLAHVVLAHLRPTGTVLHWHYHLRPS